MTNRVRVMIMTVALLIGTALLLPWRRHVAAQNNGLSGSYGFNATQLYAGRGTPAGIVGVITFDGAGNLAGSFTIAQPDSDPQAQTVQSQGAQLSGTYIVNADGTGTMNIQVQNGPTVPVSFVATDGGSNLMLLVTGGIGNILEVGTARKQ